MPNLVALIFQDFLRFQICLCFVAKGNQSFRRNQILSRNSEEDHGRNISVKFHQNAISSFREEDV